MMDMLDKDWSRMMMDYGYAGQRLVMDDDGVWICWTKTGHG